MLSLTRGTALAVILSLAGCAANSADLNTTLPQAVVDALQDEEARVALEIHDGKTVAWIVQITESQLPSRALRALESVLPPSGDAGWASLGTRIDSDGASWIAERIYPSDPGNEPDASTTARIARWAHVTSNGEVLERGYPIEAATIPAAIAKALQGMDAPGVPVVIQSLEEDRYRVRSSNSWIELDPQGRQVSSRSFSSFTASIRSGS